MNVLVMIRLGSQHPNLQTCTLGGKWNLFFSLGMKNIQERIMLPNQKHNVLNNATFVIMTKLTKVAL